MHIQRTDKTEVSLVTAAVVVCCLFARMELKLQIAADHKKSRYQLNRACRKVNTILMTNHTHVNLIDLCCQGVFIKERCQNYMCTRA